MRKKKKADFNRLNSISRGWNYLLNVILLGYGLFCIMPLALIIMASLTEEKVLAVSGYTFIPPKLTTFAYEYIIKNTPQVITAYGISIFVTVVGTILSVLVMAKL